MSDRGLNKHRPVTPPGDKTSLKGAFLYKLPGGGNAYNNSFWVVCM